MTRGVVFVDIDGTLVPHTSSGRHLAGSLGHGDVVREAESRYAAGVMSNEDVSVLDARGYAGRTPAEIRGLLRSLPLVDGIADVVSWCLGRGLTPVLATLAWAPVGDYLRERFGFAASCGPALEVADGRYTGEVATHFDEHDKRDFGARTAESLGVPLQHCAAVGDSRSDLPLFAAVGLAVAFNASPAARTAAHAVVEGPDLRAVLPPLTGWLAARPPRSGPAP